MRNEGRMTFALITVYGGRTQECITLPHRMKGQSGRTVLRLDRSTGSQAFPASSTEYHELGNPQTTQVYDGFRVTASLRIGWLGKRFLLFPDPIPLYSSILSFLPQH